MTNIADLTATQLARQFQEKKLSPVEVAEDILNRINKLNPVVNAFSQIFATETLNMARASEQRWVNNEPRGPLDGIPVTIKDMLWQQGFPNRRGSRTTSDIPMSDDAPAVARLREAGAVFVGRTTMSEYAWKATNDCPLTGVTRNPWLLSTTPGGSSGGAAVAAALNLGVMHIGTDAGGSIRIPASFTGTYGIKPSYGRVPAYPGSAFALLSHIGPMTRTVEDATIMLKVMSQPDSRDIMAVNDKSFPASLQSVNTTNLQGVRIAYSPDLNYARYIDPEVREQCEQAAKLFENMGAVVEYASPEISDPIEAIRIMWQAGSAAALNDIPVEKQSLLDPGFLNYARLGKQLTATDYLQALNARSVLLQQMLKFHEQYDALLTPSVPIPAFEVDTDVPHNMDCLDWLQWASFSYPFNLTQQPAASIPCGFTRSGLPIGLQIVGAPRQDALVLMLSKAFEQHRPFRRINDIAS